MNEMLLTLSSDTKRNKIYQQCLQASYNNQLTLNELISVGYKLMQKAKLHHHFFGDFSLLTTAQYLACHALHLPHAGKKAEPVMDILITKDETLKIINLFEKRIAEKLPVEYLTNEAEYLGYKFYVNEHVLVPRSIMNTRFEDFLETTHWQNYRVLDLCTGSGCIGISLALINKNITVDLVDISAEALMVANTNIQKYGLADRVKTVQSDLFENVAGKYDLIISNPPYVSRREYQAVPAEFKKEPKIALECGEDGLDIIHKMLAQTKNYLNPQGQLIAEIGYPAAKRVKKHYRSIPFQWFKYRRPDGKESWLGMDGIFACGAAGLP